MPDGTFTAGLRLALTTFTVAPVRAGRIDRPVAAVAMGAAPAVGAVLGALLGAVLCGLSALALPPLLAGVVVTGLAAALTRGLHLDGLADTVDALGSYRRGPEALAVMKRPDIGPFGVAALILVLLGQAAALGGLAARPWPGALAAVVAAGMTGRTAVTWACRRGVPAARPDGLGALVAGVLPTAVPVLATAATLAVAVPAVPERPWQGPVAALVALVAAHALVGHTVRRFGGITGDVIGAAVETATTLTFLGLAAGS